MIYGLSLGEILAVGELGEGGWVRQSKFHTEIFAGAKGSFGIFWYVLPQCSVGYMDSAKKIERRNSIDFPQVRALQGDMRRVCVPHVWIIIMLRRCQRYFCFEDAAASQGQRKLTIKEFPLKALIHTN